MFSTFHLLLEGPAQGSSTICNRCFNYWMITHHASRPTPRTFTSKVISYFLVKLLLIWLDWTHNGYLCWEDYWLASTLKAGVIYLMHTWRCHVKISCKQSFCLHSVLFGQNMVVCIFETQQGVVTAGPGFTADFRIDLILINEILTRFVCIQCRSFQWGFDLNQKIDCFKEALWNH